MKLTAEQIVKAKTAKSVEELITLAKAEGIEATEEEIKVKFNAMHKDGEIADEELNNVAGGFFCDDSRPAKQEMALNDEGRVVCPFCKVEFASCVLYYNNGDSYDRVGCEQCGRHFRRYWDGDVWTQD